MENDKIDFSTQSWGTEKVHKLIEMMDDGYTPRGTPFHDGDINLKKANIVWDYTQDEIKEVYKCASDINYFANKYCHVKTDTGVKLIDLRDYQERVLETYSNNQFVIFLAARQAGKCNFYSTLCNLKYKNSIDNVELGELYYASKKNKTILDKIKVVLYNIISNLTKN